MMEQLFQNSTSHGRLNKERIETFKK